MFNLSAYLDEKMRQGDLDDSDVKLMIQAFKNGLDEMTSTEQEEAWATIAPALLYALEQCPEEFQRESKVAAMTKRLRRLEPKVAAMNKRRRHRRS